MKGRCLGEGDAMGNPKGIYREGTRKGRSAGAWSSQGPVSTSGDD